MRAVLSAGRLPPMGTECKFAGPGEARMSPGGIFSGYASLFGVPDLARDIVERGAFAKAIAQRGAPGIRMLFQHDPKEPIGVWTAIREDARGLRVEGRLAGGVARAREVAALVAEGALDGLSIGFRTVKARVEAGSGMRRIVEADLWEISVVTFPMLPDARIAASGGKAVAGAIRQAEQTFNRKEPTA